MSDRTAIILDVGHWRAAQQRRENLRRAAAQGARHPTAMTSISSATASELPGT